MNPSIRRALAFGATVSIVLGAGAVAWASSPQTQTAEPACRPGVVAELTNAGGYRICPGYTLRPAGPTTSPSPSESGSASPTPTPTAAPTTTTPTKTSTPAPTTTAPKPSPSPSASMNTPSPTVAATGGRQIKAFLTGYSYFDNTPPGSADISNPVIHQKAGGTGTFSDPLTLAVGHTLSGGNDILDWPAGTRFFFPSLGKGLWAIVEDTCGDGSKPQNGPCHTGYPSNASTWLDIWVDGRTAGKDASNDCMDAITAVVTAVMLPKGAPDPGWLPAGYVPGSISSAAGCQR